MGQNKANFKLDSTAASGGLNLDAGRPVQPAPMPPKIEYKAGMSFLFSMLALVYPTDQDLPRLP